MAFNYATMHTVHNRLSYSPYSL